MERESASVRSRQPKLVIRCVRCGRILDDLALSCPQCPDALPRSEYTERAFIPADRSGIFRFCHWLPPYGTVETSIGPAVYRSVGLARRLGLRRLFIGFDGYAPRVGALNVTGTFKDFEALPTLLYLREHGVPAVILASAGNTARAFAYAGSKLNFTTYIVVPEGMLDAVWIPGTVSDQVRLIVVSASSDYAGAIHLAGRIAERYGIRSEGGARNVARRDGMGTIILEYARLFGDLPAHYVQAIGSGTGGIAAWEAAMRLRRSGCTQSPLPRLHLVQNAPFAPVHSAWTLGEPIQPNRDIAGQMRRVDEIHASVLANRNPPYDVEGGVADALRATSGRTYAASNLEIAAAQRLFLETETLPIGPESGAALAGLQQAIRNREMDVSDSILLHVTGNDRMLLEHDHEIRPIEPWLRVAPALVEGDLTRLDRHFT